MRQIFTIAILLSLVSTATSQHRGDALDFQGIANHDAPSARALARGEAFTASSGVLEGLYYNPAGIQGVQGIRIQADFGGEQYLWRENQEFRPNRFLVTLPFYLEGLYMPDPIYNDSIDYYQVWEEDYMAIWIPDSTYIEDTTGMGAGFWQHDTTWHTVKPDTGLQKYSAEAADWERSLDRSGFKSAAVVVPFSILGYDWTAGVAYHRSRDLTDYDRNDTWMDPFVGYTGYGLPDRVIGQDTLILDWRVYQRERSGDMHDLRFALAVDIFPELNLGLGVNMRSGSSDDFSRLDKIGYFGLIEQNEFFFGYDTGYVQVVGSSDWSALDLELGALLNYDRFKVGLRYTLPATLKRDYKYEISASQGPGEDNLILTSDKGSEEMTLPGYFDMGLQFQPVDFFSFNFDFGQRKYAEAEFDVTRPDSSHSQWANQRIFRFGAEWQVLPGYAILAGYQEIPEVFVPDGAAREDVGPSWNAITLGFSAQILPFLRLDAGYEMAELKYYDSYYSNTNYHYQTRNRFVTGIEIGW